MKQPKNEQQQEPSTIPKKQGEEVLFLELKSQSCLVGARIPTEDCPVGTGTVEDGALPQEPELQNKGSQQPETKPDKKYPSPLLLLAILPPVPIIGQNYPGATWGERLRSVGPCNANQRGEGQRMDLRANKQMTGKNSV